MDLTWDELSGLLLAREETDCAPCPEDCRAKYGAAWSPASFLGDPQEARRSDAGVAELSVLVLDLDHASRADFARAAAALDGLRVVVHSTHGHLRGGEDDGCYRAAVALSRPVAAADWRRFLAAAVARLGLAGLADPQCKDLSRIYFLPTSPRGVPHLAVAADGEPLDVDAVLSSAGPATAPPPEAPRLTEPGDRVGLGGAAVAGPVDLRPLRERLSRLKYKHSRGSGAEDAERAALLGRVLDGDPLGFPGDRDHSTNRACAMLAFALPPDVPLEAVQELLRPSLERMAYDPPEEYERWRAHWVAKVADRFEHHRATRVREDAERAAREAAGKARLRAVMTGRGADDDDDDPAPPPVAGVSPGGGGGGLAGRDEGGVAVPAGGGGGDAAVLGGAPVPRGLLAAASSLAEGLPGEGAEPASDDDWEDLLLWGDKGLRQCGDNARAVFEHSPAFALADGSRAVRWDDVGKRVLVLGGPLAGQPEASLDVAASDWLQREVQLFLGPSEVGAQLALVARRFPVDPVRDYLRSLSWDGVERADSWLVEYLQAREVDDVGRGVGEYLRSVGPKWLMAAVARGLSPGCRADNVLVLEGSQGGGKSSGAGVLGGAWFSDTPVAIGEKDGYMRASRSWIVELAELASLRGRETEAVKNFLTSKVDSYRPPYGRAVEDFPRRCVFIGTTNADDYLHDVTGNRRFWPVAVGEPDFERLARDRDQLWAEAVARYDAGVAWRAGEGASHGTRCDCQPCRRLRWWMTPREEVDVGARAAQEGRLADSGVLARVAEWWYGLHPSKRPEHVRPHEVAEAALGLERERVTRAVESDVSAALVRLGFSRAKRRGPGNTQLRAFVPTQEMREARQGVAAHLRAVAAAAPTPHRTTQQGTDGA